MRKSIIWKLESKKFINLVRSSNSYGRILEFFELKNHGNNYKTLKKRILKENIDDTHIKNWVINQRKNLHLTRTISLKNILIKNSTYSNRSCLKKRLIKNGLLKNVCYLCGLPPLWNNNRLVFVLDHINGDNSDYRIKNLRLLCPNCNSQTHTFCGRNNSSRKRAYKCSLCGRELKGEGKTGLCSGCLIKLHPPAAPKRKFEILKKDLKKLVWEKSLEKIGADFKVSGVAIKKRCKLLGIKVPGRGYWAKKYAGKI